MKRLWGIRHFRWAYYWLSYLALFNSMGGRAWEFVGPGEWAFLQDVWEGKA